MITLDCSKCGAPLEAEEGASFVTCKFCHTQTIVPNHNERSTAAEPSFELPDPGYAPPVGRTLVPYFGLLTLLIGGIVTYASLRSGGRMGLGASRGSVYKSCFVDANGDDALDVAMVRTIGDGVWYSELVDGVSGETRWHSERLGDLSGIACAGHHFVVASKDFKTFVHDARSPGTPHVVQGRDVTRYVSPGEGCLSLRADDESTSIVGLDGRALEACPPVGAQLDVVVGETGVLGLTDDEVTLPSGEQLLARETGTEVLSVRLAQSSPPTELSLIKCDFTAALAVNADTVFLHACAIGNDDDGFVIALRKGDLTERWRKPVAGISADHVNFFAWNGRMLVLSSFGVLHAFDASGNATWSVSAN